MSSSAVIEYIQSRGERITMPRRIVIEALGEAHQHLTIHALQQHIQEAYPDYPVSDTTIYRVLQWLKGLELISQTDMGQDGIVYALVESPFHHHLICLNCGKTFTVADELFTVLRQQLREEYDFEARIDHMAIYGRCRNCIR